MTDGGSRRDSTAQYFSLDVIENGSPIRTFKLAAASSRYSSLDLNCPRRLYVAIGLLETFEELGSDLRSFADRKTQHLSE